MYIDEKSMYPYEIDFSFKGEQPWLSAYNWCRNTFAHEDWVYSAWGFCFKNEQDAMMFTLKWCINA